MNANDVRCEGAQSGLGSGLYVWLAVELADTAPAKMVAFVTDLAGVAAFLDMSWRCGGWKSIRVEPLSAESALKRFGAS